MEVSFLSIILFWFTIVHANICPPASRFPPECACDSVKKTIKCPSQLISTRWDMKSTFSKIANAIGNPNVIFDRLELNGVLLSNPQEIPANVILETKFRTIDITGANKFANIDENAFPGTYGVTEYFQLHSNHHLESNTVNLFKFFNKFTKLKRLVLHQIQLKSIPADAFVNGPSTLEHFQITASGLSKIGERAFDGLPMLNLLNLQINNLNSESIGKTAFAKLPPQTRLQLGINIDLTTLPESIFKSFLDRTTSTLEVGNGTPGDTGADVRFMLTCDKGVNWICDNSQKYEKKLIGYRCKDLKHKFVFDYCKAIKDNGEDKDKGKDKDNGRENDKGKDENKNTGSAISISATGTFILVFYYSRLLIIDEL